MIGIITMGEKVIPVGVYLTICHSIVTLLKKRNEHDMCCILEPLI